MHGFQKYANVCLWPKADIETESKALILNVCFRGEKRTFSRYCQLERSMFYNVGNVAVVSLIRDCAVVKNSTLCAVD